MSDDVSPAPGMVLIAPPVMEDPNFRRTVVFLCEHTEAGSFGLILNRPLDARLSDVLEGVSHASLQLQQGGPVQTDTLHFLHTLGERIPGAIQVTDRVFWGGDFEVLRAMIVAGEIEEVEVRFFLGYAGWSPAQLEAEIEQGGWILLPNSGQIVFSEDPAELWRASLRRLGGDYAVLANFPEDPRLN